MYAPTLTAFIMLGGIAGALSDCTSGPDVGPCEALFSRYFFNVTSGQCQFFHYGGCGGNDNNYKTLDECERTCEELSLEDCSAESKVGMCRAAFPRFHFDVETGQCKDFIYGGCDGNKNNFRSEEECRSKCGRFAPKEMTREECCAEPEGGMCGAAFPLYYFDPKSGKCEEFIYGGCGGNSNRFGDEEECRAKCGKYKIYKLSKTVDVCVQPRIPGPCRAAVPRFHFDVERGSCREFLYGGCGGNNNNFKTIEDCQHTCLDKYSDPR